MNYTFVLALLPAFICTVLSAQTTFETPDPAQRTLGLQPEDLAVIVNDDDPNSVAVAEYYRHARGIPAKNFVHVRIPGSPQRLTQEQFQKFREEVEGKIARDAQAMVMVWTTPYAVECNSITSAMTLGFDARQCANTCAPGKASAYYNFPSGRLRTTVVIRPSMLLPTDSVAQAKALIDRGVQSEFRLVQASAYFLVTSDTARNSRASRFPRSQEVPSRKLTIKTIKQEKLSHVDDI
ncbi:MAG: TIGR03790 family protein, partial [Proteobacteria bacterium]